MSCKLSPERVRFQQQHAASNISTRTLTSTIKTGGEFFSDGRSISLLRDSSTERLKLLLAGGKGRGNWVRGPIDFGTVEASLLLALLSCLVRHPLPLVEISAAPLRSLPMNLHPHFADRR
jgi:hypothetical protein